GVCRPMKLQLRRSPPAAAWSVIYLDRRERAEQRIRGGLTPPQASDHATEHHQRLSTELTHQLRHAPRWLRRLVARHHLTEEVMPARLATLRIDAVPIAPEGRSARQWLHARYGSSIVAQSRALVWLETSAYLALLRSCQRATTRQTTLHL